MLLFGATWLPVAAAELDSPPELGRFLIREPLGVDWPDEWVTREVSVNVAGAPIPVSALRVVDESGTVLPAQFYDRDGELLDEKRQLRGKVRLKAFVHVSVAKKSDATFLVTRGGPAPPDQVTITSAGSRTVVDNGVYEFVFDSSDRAIVNELRCGKAKRSLVRCRWPEGVEPTGVVDRWLERGPARSILRREFAFRQPTHRYTITFEFRAGDPWVDVTDEYALGARSAITWDLSAMDADVVFHPYAYNARTFRPGGSEEDSTLEPPQHPIATLGPVWRDIWYNGGPYAFVYRAGSDCGLGFAAVRGSEWKATDAVSKASQNLRIHGDREVAGRVRVEFPTDGGLRCWALAVAHPDDRKRMSRWTRARADIPLDRVLRDWVLQWQSDAPPLDYSFALQWFGPFNRHLLNPTTFPRNVRRFLNKLFDEDVRHVHSSHLAFLAYVFTDPNYWPGPEIGWGVACYLAAMTCLLPTSAHGESVTCPCCHTRPSNRDGSIPRRLCRRTSPGPCAAMSCS
jgi:hypothetical protein